MYQLGEERLISSEREFVLDSLRLDGSAIVRLRRIQPDVIVAGIARVTAEALEYLGAVRETCPWTMLLVTIPMVDSENEPAVRRRGADGVLAYESVIETLVPALRRVLARAAEERAADPVRRAIDTLSPVLRGVAALMSTGASDRAIAEALTIAPGTVHKHVIDVRAAFGSPKRSALMLALAARRRGPAMLSADFGLPSTDSVSRLSGLRAPADPHAPERLADSAGSDGQASYFVPWYTDE